MDLYAGLSGPKLVSAAVDVIRAIGSARGPVDGLVAAMLLEVDSWGDDADLRADCRESGAWDDCETADIDDIRARVLWTACCSEVESQEEHRREHRKGGPGHDGYTYQADVWCVDCGREIIDDLARELKLCPVEHADSDDVPCPIFFGESDTAQHCADCGEYLYGEDVSE